MAEVLFGFVVACLDYGGKGQQALGCLKRARNITHTLSRSQFNRRRHGLQDRLQELLALLRSWAKVDNQRFTYGIDAIFRYVQVPQIYSQIFGFRYGKGY